MDSARLATELTSARFGSTQFRQGYDMADVDRFVDEVVAALHSREPAEGLAARVRAVRFSTTSWQRGYDMADVDDLLESVAASLEAGGTWVADAGTATTKTPTRTPAGTPTGRPTRTPTSSGTATSSEPEGARPGVLSRLLAAVRGDQPLR